MEQHIKSFRNFVETWPYCEGNNIAEVWVGRGTDQSAFVKVYGGLNEIPEINVQKAPAFVTPSALNK